MLPAAQPVHPSSVASNRLYLLATLLRTLIPCINTQISIVSVLFARYPMARPTFLVSTPMSRRTQRKLQKQRRTTRQRQDGDGLWAREYGKASNEHRDWLSASNPFEHTSTPTPPSTSSFEPGLKIDLSASKSKSQYKWHVLTSQVTNPFSLLDVQIPSPNLSMPSSPQGGPVQHLPDHDVHGIGFGTTIGLPTLPPEAVIHHIRQDE